MITNIRLELNDDERAVLAVYWFGRKALVTRKEVADFVNTKIQLAILERPSQEVEPEPDAQIEVVTAIEPPVERDRCVREFVPSRGDEPYLYRPQNPELAAACTTILDNIEVVEKFVWDKLERNRQQ